MISKTAQDGKWDEVKVLLDKTANRSNADIEGKNEWSKSWTLLHYTVYNGSLNLMKGIFKFLLDKVGDINARDRWNWTPLHYAAYYNEPGIGAFLIDKDANINAENDKGKTPLEVAHEYNKSEVISTFINKAIEKDKSDVVKNFFKKSAERLSVEDRDEWRTNWTLLHYAAYNGKSGIVQGSFNLLLEKSGGDINVKENQYDYTPLQYAVYYNRPEIVKLYLNNGADIEAKDKDRKTPLHLAAKEGYMDIINLLLDNGANVEAKDQYDWTPFQYAESKSRSDVVRLFKGRCAISGENECKPIHYAAHNDKLDLINILLNKDADIEAKDKDGKTPLHHAAQEGYVASISLLLKKGAEINVTTYDSDWSWTPLHYAVHHKKLDAVKCLVDNDANVNAKDKHGRTPLHYAARGGCMASISLLLKKGAEINVTTYNSDRSWTPLHYATYYNKPDAVKYLLDNNANVNAKDKDGNVPAYYTIGGRREFDARSKSMSSNLRMS